MKRKREVSDTVVEDVEIDMIVTLEYGAPRGLLYVGRACVVDGFTIDFSPLA